MALGIQKPHIPFLAPDKYFDLYPANGLQFTPATLEFWDQAPRIAQTSRYKGFGFEFGVRNDDLRREFIQAYHACISFIDAQIGIVLNELQLSGQADNTIVVLTSDHGYLLGEKFMWGKVMLFETCVRVPLIIRVPETLGRGFASRGSQSEGLVELLDLYPTLAELCEISPPAELQGQRLVPILQKPTLPAGRGLHRCHSRPRSRKSDSNHTLSLQLVASRGRALRPLNSPPREHQSREIESAHRNT